VSALICVSYLWPSPSLLCLPFSFRISLSVILAGRPSWSLLQLFLCISFSDSGSSLKAEILSSSVPRPGRAGSRVHMLWVWRSLPQHWAKFWANFQIFKSDTILEKIKTCQWNSGYGTSLCNWALSRSFSCWPCSLWEGLSCGKIKVWQGKLELNCTASLGGNQARFWALRWVDVAVLSALNILNGSEFHRFLTNE
jgi:hypothetical protein